MGNGASRRFYSSAPAFLGKSHAPSAPCSTRKEIDSMALFAGTVSQIEESKTQPQHVTDISMEEKEEEEDEDNLEFVGYVPIINTTALEISASNPFGLRVQSIEAARDELISFLQVTTKEDHDITEADSDKWNDKFRHYRIEYLVKYLESKFIPIHTTQFLSLAIGGDWNLVYSNVLTPLADEAIQYQVSQRIKTNEECTGGEVENKIFWSLDQSGNHGDSQTQQGSSIACGNLYVRSNFDITPKGSIALELQEHVLMPDKLPRDPEALIMGLQRTVPFNFFDPHESIMSHSYVDPEIRIARVTGAKFVGIFNVFVRCKESQEWMQENIKRNKKRATV